jgi:tRNA threonylcarbamoyl adenosine modification protein YeaZ
MSSLTLLAIDSSTDNASLAVIRNGEVLAETAWHCQQNHSVELMPHIKQLLGQADTGIKSIDGVIVARGPGSFNGLRVGISTAKGLAFSLGVPLVGISTLEAAAYQYAKKGLPVCPILNAGRGEIATAVYRLIDGEWQQVMVEHISTIDDLCPKITTETIFCGEPAPSIIGGLTARLGRKAIIPPPESGLRRAVFLAALGLKRLQAGDCDQPSTLQPIYLRHPQITQPKNKYQATNPISKP